MIEHSTLYQQLLARCLGISHQWYSAIAATSFTPFPAAAVQRRLYDLTTRLIDLLFTAHFDPSDGEMIGATLIQLHYVQPAALRNTMQVLGQIFSEQFPASEHDLHTRLISVVGSIASGFYTAGREKILAEQEDVRGALLVERNQKEAALRASQATTKALLEAIPDLILQVDRLGNCLVYKPNHADTLQLPVEAVLNQPLTNMWPEEIALELGYYIECAIVSAVPQVFEFQLRQQQVVEFEARVVPCGVDHALVLVRDVTQRKRMMMELRIREAELRAIFESAAVGIALTTIQGEFLNTNPAFLQILGYTKDEYPPQLFFDLVHPDDDAQDTSPYHNLLTGDHPSYELEKRFTHHDGDVRWVHITVSLLGSNETQTDLTLLLVEDITERKRTEAAVMHLHKLDSLGVLAGGIAHEFNNILIVILGNAELARLDLPATTPVIQYVNQIEAAAQRAAELVKQMLMYVGHFSADVSMLNLTTLIDEMRGLLDIAIPQEKDIQLTYTTQPIASLYADALQMRQVVVTLIMNAADAIDQPAGTIDLSTGTLVVDKNYQDTAHLTLDLNPGSYVYLEVTDSGRGMDPHTSAMMFDPFFTTKASGSGLSLAAVLGIVRRYDGAIQVWSRPSSGTTVRILLPCVASLSDAQLTCD